MLDTYQYINGVLESEFLRCEEIFAHKILQAYTQTLHDLFTFSVDLKHAFALCHQLVFQIYFPHLKPE